MVHLLLSVSRHRFTVMTHKMCLWFSNNWIRHSDWLWHKPRANPSKSSTVTNKYGERKLICVQNVQAIYNSAGSYPLLLQMYRALYISIRKWSGPHCMNPDIFLSIPFAQALSYWIKTAGEQQFSILATDSQSDWGLCFDWDILTHTDSWIWTTLV